MRQLGPVGLGALAPGDVADDGHHEVPGDPRILNPGQRQLDDDLGAGLRPGGQLDGLVRLLMGIEDRAPAGPPEWARAAAYCCRTGSTTSSSASG